MPEVHELTSQLTSHVLFCLCLAGTCFLCFCVASYMHIGCQLPEMEKRASPGVGGGGYEAVIFLIKKSYSISLA